MIPGIYLLPVRQNGDRKKGGGKLPVACLVLVSPSPPVILSAWLCHCLRPIMEKGRGGPVEMCVINLPAPKNRISSANGVGGAGGIPTSSPLLQCCRDCLSPVWSLSAYRLLSSILSAWPCYCYCYCYNEEGRGAQ
jgi:hypothetical protein